MSDQAFSLPFRAWQSLYSHHVQWRIFTYSELGIQKNLRSVTNYYISSPPTLGHPYFILLCLLTLLGRGGSIGSAHSAPTTPPHTVPFLEITHSKPCPPASAFPPQAPPSSPQAPPHSCQSSWALTRRPLPAEGVQTPVQSRSLTVLLVPGSVLSCGRMVAVTGSLLVTRSRAPTWAGSWG